MGFYKVIHFPPEGDLTLETFECDRLGAAVMWVEDRSTCDQSAMWWGPPDAARECPGYGLVLAANDSNREGCGVFFIYALEK